MLKQDCKVGMVVTFGRANGEKTRAKVEKLNPTKAKVSILEDRGSKSKVGDIWVVTYSALEPVSFNPLGVQEPRTTVTYAAPEKLEYNPFDYVQNLILEAIVACYSGLSPENLTCDGEASMASIRHRRSILTRQLNGLEKAFGRPVGEIAAYNWQANKREYEKTHLKLASR